MLYMYKKNFFVLFVKKGMINQRTSGALKCLNLSLFCFLILGGRGGGGGVAACVTVLIGRIGREEDTLGALPVHEENVHSALVPHQVHKIHHLEEKFWLIHKTFVSFSLRKE